MADVLSEEARMLIDDALLEKRRAIPVGATGATAHYGRGRRASPEVAERRQRVLEMARAGSSAAEISLALGGVSPATIRMDIYRLRRSGVVLPRMRPERAEISLALGGGTDMALARREASAVKARARVVAVRDRRRFKVTPVPTGAAGTVISAEATGTIFPSKVRTASEDHRVLKDGASNAKIGGDVLVGWLRGARIVTLTLEERATCPRSCDLWDRCLAPGTRVLTSDLRWVPIESLSVGDRIAGFQEHGAPRRERTTQIATVEKLGRSIEPCFKITTNRGTVTASAKHMWPVRRGRRTDFRWRDTDRLRVGDHMQFFMEPWETDTSYDAGRLRGFVEGEGTCVLHKNNGYPKATLGWSQRPTKLCDEIIEVANRLGFRTSRGERIAGVKQTAVSHISVLNGWRGVAEFLGRIRPTRMIEKSEAVLQGRSIGGQHAEILKIEPVGDTEVVTIKTSTSTLIAEGFFTHNCYGSGMPRATRWRPGAELEAAIERETAALCAEHEKVLVRLHVLGDWYSVGYVAFWGRLLRRHAGLHVFGFTAHPPETEIGNRLAQLRGLYGRRFSMRHSGQLGPWGSATIDFPTERKTIGDGIVCPEQSSSMAGRDDRRHCGSCGVCWSSDRTVIFIEH